MRKSQSVAWLAGALLAVPAVPAADPTTTAPALTPAQALLARRTPAVEVFERCRDAVVNIAATQIIEMRSPWDDLFPGFDLPGQPRRRFATQSVGSGFVIHPAGYLVTNAHVVARTADRKAVFADKREYPAAIVALDQERDLAVLKIESPQPLKPIQLGRSDDLMVGESVVAIGNPFGYQNTCTVGVVSAIGRTIDMGNDIVFKDLIQIDAPINPGNSGGALLNVLGELVGVNTAIRGDAQNIGFAIPVDQLKSVLPEMLDVERRYRIAHGIRLDRAGSAAIESVEAGSPAAAAGLQAGDRITRLGDQAVSSSVDFHIALLGHKAADRITLEVSRQGRTSQVRITLAARPVPDGGKLLARRLGIQAQPLTERMAAALRVRGLNALMVDQVEAGSPAADIGLRRGDLILQIGRHPAGSLDDLGDLLEKVAVGQAVPVTVLRVQGNLMMRSTTTLKAR